MHRRVSTESLERPDQLSFLCVAGEIDLVDRDVELLAASGEALEIGVRGWIDPDRNHRDARCDTPRVEGGAAFARVFVQLLRECLAVQEAHGDR